MGIRIVSLLFLLISCHASKSNDMEGGGETTPPPRMYVKRQGDDIYVSAKMDAQTDILYLFRKCMANELYTFYRVGMTSNSGREPTTSPDAEPEHILNLAYSDNIGPLAVSGGGFCGGNHKYRELHARTAYNESYRLLIDGQTVDSDITAWATDIAIESVNAILNPTIPYTAVDGSDELRDVLSRETVVYNIYNNNIEVTLTHEFINREPVTISIYYGMQSMFDGETHTFTSGGAYTDWTEQESVSEFTKGRYPHFRRFIEKSPVACQSAFLLPDGIGDHRLVKDNDVVFIGNSHGKSYHKLIDYEQMADGDKISWRGVYTWYRTALADDGDLLCYEGVVGGRPAFFIDTKRPCERSIELPEGIDITAFEILDTNGDITVSPDSETALKISSGGTGGCVVVLTEGLI